MLSVILGHMTVYILIGAGVVFLPDVVINSEEDDLPSSSVLALSASAITGGSLSQISITLSRWLKSSGLMER